MEGHDEDLDLGLATLQKSSYVALATVISLSRAHFALNLDFNSD
jgi:hypothetical protein